MAKIKHRGGGAAHAASPPADARTPAPGRARGARRSALRRLLPPYADDEAAALAAAAARELAAWAALLALAWTACVWLRAAAVHPRTAAALLHASSSLREMAHALARTLRAADAAAGPTPPLQPPLHAVEQPLRGAPPAAGLACCGLTSAAELLACANATAPLDPPPGAPRPRVVVVTQVTGSVLDYAAPAALVNGLWAEAHGYAFVVLGAAPAQPRSYDGRYGKVALVRQLLSRGAPLEYVFWIDADAVVVHHAFDVLADVASRHPAASLVACAEANLETNTRINSGTMLVRASDWSRRFFDAWWSHADAAIGAPDQWTFDALWRDDVLGVRSDGRAAIVPATSFNSEPPFYETFRGGAQQPVVHLMGDATLVRRRIFDRMAAALCAAAQKHTGGAAGTTSPSSAAADWPPVPAWLLQEMRAGYTAVAADVALSGEARVHALDRLGMLLHAEGRHSERAELLRTALELKERAYGRDSPQIAHEVQVLANVLSMLERHDEALPLMRRALKLNEAATDPKGEPMPHLVAAAHGDLGSLFGRMGDWANALVHLQHCLDIEEHIWGPGNRHSADTVFNLGVTAQLSGDRRGALPYFERALRAYRAHLAADHPAIARAEVRIAMCRAEL